MSTPSLSQDPASTARGGSRFGFVALWLCATTGLGCPAAQVMPEPGDCPEEARRNMFEVLKMEADMLLGVHIDVHQLGPSGEVGTYSEGPIVGRLDPLHGNPPEFPAGTLLYGRLWTAPGILDRDGYASVVGRYTEAVLPDGQRLRVCMALGGPYGRVDKLTGSKPGAVRLYKSDLLSPVRRWP